MARNPFWTPANAATALSLFNYPGASDHLVLDFISEDGRASDVVLGSLDAIFSIDFYTVDMTAGYEYTYMASGDYQPTLAIFDTAGYLLVSLDGDQRGFPDTYRIDSEWFVPEYSGRYWISVGWEYVPGANGTYALIASVPAAAVGYEPPPPPPQLPTVNGTGGADSLDGGEDGESIRGFSGDDTIRGLDGDDFVYGDDGNDDVNGNLGNDKVHGGPGQDFVRGGQGDDAVYGQEDDDWHVNGNIGNDSVYGGTGNDIVFGGPGQDTLYGEVGNDVLSGDLGNDRLYGGPGWDQFVFHSGAGWDLIQDFKRSEGDKILVEGNINGTGMTTAQQLANSAVSDGGGGWIIDIGNGDKIGIVNAAKPVPDDFWIV